MFRPWCSHASSSYLRPKTKPTPLWKYCIVMGRSPGSLCFNSDLLFHTSTLLAVKLSRKGIYAYSTSRINIHILDLLWRTLIRSAKSGSEQDHAIFFGRALVLIRRTTHCSFLLQLLISSFTFTAILANFSHTLCTHTK